MATLKELRDERLRKLEELRKLGVNPYPSHVDRTHTLEQIVNGFTELENQRVTVIGRVIGVRKLGKIAFIVIREPNMKLQLFLKSDALTSADPSASEINFDQIYGLLIIDYGLFP